MKSSYLKAKKSKKRRLKPGGYVERAQQFEQEAAEFLRDDFNIRRAEEEMRDEIQ